MAVERRDKLARVLGEGVAVGPDGSVYLTGFTDNRGFPTSDGADDENFNGGIDAFIVKVAAGSGAVLYSTYVGGAMIDRGKRVVVGLDGQATVLGDTDSDDFPVFGGFDSTYGGFGDVFVTRLNAAGSDIVVSTYLGSAGTDNAGDIDLGTDLSVVVCGSTRAPSFPTTPGAFDETFNGNVTGTPDAFVTRLNSGLSGLVFSTFLGSIAEDEGLTVAVGPDMRVAVAGRTTSTGFPVTAEAFDTTLGGASDGFVSLLSADGSQLNASSFVGGSDIDTVNDVAIDSGSGEIAIVGDTNSANFPVTPGAFEDTFVAYSGFALLVSPSGRLVASTFVAGGSSSGDYSEAKAVDYGSDGRLLVAGRTGSPGFPVTSTAPDTVLDGQDDGFVCVLAESLTVLNFSTFLGGSGSENLQGAVFGPSNTIVASGFTSSLDFGDTTVGAHDGDSAFVAWLDLNQDAGADTPGVYAAAFGAWFLRNSSTPGPADAAFSFGPSDTAWIPIRGDWNGDGADTPGLYDRENGFFFLTNTNVPGPAQHVYGFGPAGSDWTPIAGDWDGDGIDTVGLYAPSVGVFFLRNEHRAGAADSVFGFGPPAAGWVPLSGDWDGDGLDTVGLYAPLSGSFFLRNSLAPGGADLVYSFGPAGLGWNAIVGDFDGDNVDTVGLYSPPNGFFFLRNSHQPGPADLTFGFGPPNVNPLAGDWDGL